MQWGNELRDCCGTPLGTRKDERGTRCGACLQHTAQSEGEQGQEWSELQLLCYSEAVEWRNVWRQRKLATYVQDDTSGCLKPLVVLRVAHDEY